MIGGRAYIARRRVFVTDHAVERYQERVKPALDLEQAQAEVMRLLPGLEFTFERPVWAAAADQPHTEWVMVGDGIAFVVHGERVVRCVTRSETGAEVRIVKQKIGQQKRSRKSAPGQREKHGKVARHGKVQRDARRRAQDQREAME
jgi:hypothetical protein